MFIPSKQGGFTLIEIVVVVALISILLTISLIAINPARQFAQANNTKRRSDVTVILNSISQYMTDNNGSVPSGITTTSQNIADSGADICSDIITTYMAELPQDPSLGGIGISNCGAVYDSGYTVFQSPTDNRITVSAPSAEIGGSISVSR